MNRLANHRLHTACAALSAEDYAAARVGFFPSIRATLNHILLVDRFYINALEGHPLDRAALDAAQGLTTLQALRAAQAQCDARLLAFVAALTPERLTRSVTVDRGDRQQHDRADDLLAHLFQHQTHHRGQVHAMLSSTRVAPPQLDEFIVSDDAAARAKDMAALGWSEADLMR
ncbi:MAG: DinB family protein [Cypionkella sp.]|uniref:DinB family protein n=1 Tax=Cypionkella sp. TaxID=2811411 RepID=UPI002AB90D1A|nr:DinB family protein [Cypionkella sp.]MDZ4310600.1 DinB family protein [Cypionkella sp.]